MILLGVFTPSGPALIATRAQLASDLRIFNLVRRGHDVDSASTAEPVKAEAASESPREGVSR